MLAMSVEALKAMCDGSGEGELGFEEALADIGGVAGDVVAQKEVAYGGEVARDYFALDAEVGIGFGDATLESELCGEVEGVNIERDEGCGAANKAGVGYGDIGIEG